MSNFEKARELTKVAAESQGMAELKYQAYMESSEAATKRLQNAWEGLTNSFRTSDFLAGIKNAVAWLVENLDKVASTLGNILLSVKTMRSISAIQMLSKTTNKSFMGATFSSIGKKAKAGWDKVFDYTTGGGLEAYLPRYSNYLQDLVRMVGTISHQKPTSVKPAPTAGGTTGGSIQVFDTSKGQAAQGADGNWYYINKDNTLSKRKVNKTEAAKLDQQKAALDNRQSQQKIAAKGGTLGQRVGRGIATGAVAGMVQGFSTYGTLKNRDGELASQETRVAMGIASGLSTAVATGVISAIPYVGPVLGPTLGPLIGQAFNMWVAPALGNILDQQAIARRERSKDAEKSYSAIKAIQNDTNSIKELSSNGSWTFDEYQKAQNSVNNISKQLYGNTKAARILYQQIFNGEDLEKSDLTIVKELQTYLEQMILNGDIASRQTAIDKWEAALYQSEVNTYRASKENELYEGRKALNTNYVRGFKLNSEVKKAVNDFISQNPNLVYTDGGSVVFTGDAETNQNTRRDLLETLEDQGLTSTTFYKKLQKSVADISNALSGIDSTVDEINSKQTNASAITAKVTAKTQSELKTKGIDWVAEQILEKVNEEGGFFNEDATAQYKYLWTGSLETLAAPAKKYIEEYIKGNSTLYGILSGQSYTLGEVNNGALTGAKADQYKLSFARQLNITVEELNNNLERYSSFSLGDVMKGYEEVKSALETIDGLVSSIVSSTGLTADNLATLLSKFPDLVQYAGNLPELVGYLFNKTDVFIEKQQQNLLDDLTTNEGFFTEWKKSLSSEIVSLIDQTALGNTGNGGSFWQALLNLSDADKATLGDALEEIKESFTNTYDNITADVGIYTGILDKWRTYLSKVYELQIKNLQDQKSAIENINKQREYENRLVEARLKLENAQNEKNMVFREGVGFVYEADQEAIAEAEKEIKELENEKVIDSLDMVITELQSQKDWLDQFTEREEFQNLAQAFGEDSPVMETLGKDKNSGLWGTVNKLLTKYEEVNRLSTSGWSAIRTEFDKKEEAQVMEAYNMYGNDYDTYKAIQDEIANARITGDTTSLQNKLAEIRDDKDNYSASVRTFAGNMYNELTSEGGASADNLRQYQNNAASQKDTALKNASLAANTLKEKFKNNAGDRFATNVYDEATDTWKLSDAFKESANPEGKPRLTDFERSQERERAKKEIVEELAKTDYGAFLLAQSGSDGWLIGTKTLSGDTTGWESELYAALETYFSTRTYKTNVGALQQYKSDMKIAHRNGPDSSIEKSLERIYNDPNVDPTVKSFIKDELDRYNYDIFSNGYWIFSPKYDLIGYGDLMKMIDAMFADEALIPRVHDAVQLSNAKGSLSTRGGLSSISELGPELFATPGLSGTALIPEGSKVLPADATKGLWEFGSFASEFVKPLRSLLSGFGNGDTVGFGTDESTNINTLNITLRADKDFDADKFIQQLKLLQAISKNNA